MTEYHRTVERGDIVAGIDQFGGVHFEFPDEIQATGEADLSVSPEFMNEVIETRAEVL